MHPRRRGGGLNMGLGVFLLASELYRTGLANIPPVTLGFLAFNSTIYLRLLRIVKHVGDACVSYQHVWRMKQWKRLFLASFFHLDDMHLYFNMISFLWKGRTLEQRYGSRKFFIIILMFALLSQMLLLVLNRILALLLWDGSYLTSCAAGFSAVIFALKVLTTNGMWEESVSVLGFPVTVPAQFACWIELVLIQILVPNASFTGHLAGILVGFAFVHGPLERLVNFINDSIGNFSGLQQTGRQTINRNASYSYRSGRSGYRNETGRDAEAEDRNAREEWELQEAIRRSMQDIQFTSTGAQGQQNSSLNQQNLPYGWNIPGMYPEDQHTRNRRSPRHSNLGFNQMNPPYPADAGSFHNEEDDIASPPYPTNDDSAMPHYQNPHSQARLYPSLRDQEAPQNGENNPSAPPLENLNF